SRRTGDRQPDHAGIPVPHVHPWSRAHTRLFRPRPQPGRHRVASALAHALAGQRLGDRAPAGKHVRDVRRHPAPDGRRPRQGIERRPDLDAHDQAAADRQLVDLDRQRTRCAALCAGLLWRPDHGVRLRHRGIGTGPADPGRHTGFASAALRQDRAIGIG
ncbi:hypothetical protein QU38_02150, partial [Staphylococcus aureus]